MLWNVRRILQRGPAYRITRREQRSQRAMRDYRCIEYIQRVYTSVIFLFKQFYGSVLNAYQILLGKSLHNYASN